MDSVNTFLQNFDLTSLVSILVTAVVSLFCITWHELSHGYTALKLGDPTAKNQGRLSLNPIRHIDPLGLLMMIIAHFGWAKPVPIDPRYFKNPKKGMAITALTGPVSNIVLSWLSLLVSSGIYYFWAYPTNSTTAVYVMAVLIRIAVLSAGLGIFNLIPFPPLDGSKVLFSLLPDRIYYKILRYERFGLIIMLILAYTEVAGGLLSKAIILLLRGLCAISGLPFDVMIYIYAYVL